MFEPTSTVPNFGVNWGKWWPDMTSYGLNERFWAMLEPNPTGPNPTGPNFDGQRFMLLGARQVILSNVRTD